MKLKIMTYNVASGRVYEDTSKINSYGGCPQDLSRCASIIRGISPDFCGINEINHYHSKDIAIKNQPEFLANNTGLTYCVFGRAMTTKSGGGRDYGNAVISKHPIISSEIISIPDPVIKDENKYYENRSITKVKLDIAGGITVLQTHMGLAIAEAKNAVNTVFRLLDEIDGPVILMGDFNMRPSNILIDMLRERLFDTALIRDDYIPTFPSYIYPEGFHPGDETPPCKIDYIFVSKHFKTLSIDVINTSVSDHMPVVVEVEIEI